MKNAIRWGLIVALALGPAGARADDDPYSTGDPAQAPAEVSAGAGSMEPRQAIDEEPGSAVHQQWVESIWISP
jgi:hypothetical protein